MAAMAGLSGCAALGPVGAVGAIYATMAVGAETVRDSDQKRRNAAGAAALEQELRALLPMHAPLAPGATAEKPPAPRPPRVEFAIDGDATPRNEGSGNVTVLTITISGEILPPTARLLAEGVRRIAWRRADPISLLIYGLPGPPGEPLETPRFGILDPLYAARGLKKHVEQHFNPYEDVRKALVPLMPTTATGRTGLWGQALYGEFALHPGPRIEVSGDFSPASAAAFVDASKAAFPEMAVTVFRDETRQRSGWVKLATYQPPTPAPLKPADPVH